MATAVKDTRYFIRPNPNPPKISCKRQEKKMEENDEPQLPPPSPNLIQLYT